MVGPLISWTNHAQLKDEIERTLSMDFLLSRPESSYCRALRSWEEYQQLYNKVLDHVAAMEV